MGKIDERFNLSISLSLQSVEDTYQVAMDVASDDGHFSKRIVYKDLDYARADYDRIIGNMEDIEEVIYYGKD